MKVLIFDTETTGLPLWSKPSDHPDQPHIVQFVGVRFDSETDEELEYFEMIAKPDGWVIPDGSFKIHGITTDRALEEGVPERHAVDAFLSMEHAANLVAGFNVPFDLRIMRIAMFRAGISKEACDEHALTMRPKVYDVMPKCTPLCHLPPTDRMMAAGRKTFKPPTLSEAVSIILGEKMDGAHDARADVEATRRLWHRINKEQAA